VELLHVTVEPLRNIYLLFVFNNASGPSTRCFSSLIFSFHLSLVRREPVVYCSGRRIKPAETQRAES
jgi:hypothetical protein